MNYPERIEIVNPNPRKVFLMMPGRTIPEIVIERGGRWDCPFYKGMTLVTDGLAKVVLRDTTYGEDGDEWMMDVTDKPKEIVRPFD